MREKAKPTVQIDDGKVKVIEFFVYAPPLKGKRPSNRRAVEPPYEGNFLRGNGHERQNI